MLQGVMSRHFAEVFVPQYRKSLHVNTSLLCSGKFPIANKLMDNKGGGVSRLSIENFLSYNSEKCRSGIL